MKKIFILLPILYFGKVTAQDSLNNQWNKIEFEKTFLKHQIPLYLERFDTINLGNSTVNYFTRNNKFKDVYTAKKSEGFNVQSERFVTVKDWKFYGKFSFSKYEEKQTGFTAMANPYRDNPYKIADSTTNADWKKQHYLLDAQILTPEFAKNLKAGVGIKYEILNGARQIDPRPSDKLVDIEITPQFVYQFNNWQFGGNGYYNHFREDLMIEMENIQQPKNIYKSLGLGEYLYNNPIVTSSSSALNRTYNANNYGGGITVGNQFNTNNFFQFSASYKKVNEKAIDGTTNPYNAGEHTQNILSGILTYQYNRGHYNHIVSLEGNRADIENREFVQSLNTTTEQYEQVYNAIMHYQLKNSIALNYGLQITNNQQTVWNLGVGAIYNYNDQQYPTTQSRMETESYVLNAFAKRWFNIKNVNVAVGYQTTYKANADNMLRYNADPNFTNFVVNSILYPNFAFNNTNYWANQLDVQVTLPTFRNWNSQLYFKVNYQNISSIQEYLNHNKGLSNNYFNFTIGLLN